MKGTSLVFVLTGALLLFQNGTYAEFYRNTSSSHSNYSPADRKRIELVRATLRSELYQDFMTTDDYLIRFLKAKDDDVNNAVSMLSKAIKWRKENRMESIMSRNFTSLLKLCPFSIEPGALDGGPVLMFPLWNLRHLMLTAHRNDIPLFLARLMQLVEDTVREFDKRSELHVTQAIVILEMHNFNVRQHMCLACSIFFTELFTTYENYFPRMISHFIEVNTPRAAGRLIKNAVKPVLSKQTLQIFEVYGLNRAEYEPRLRKIVKPEIIKKIRGGIKES